MSAVPDGAYAEKSWQFGIFMTQANEQKAAKISRKEQILQSLGHMLEKNPGTRITTSSLAKEVGLSEAALYRHFAKIRSRRSRRERRQRGREICLGHQVRRERGHSVDRRQQNFYFFRLQ